MNQKQTGIIVLAIGVLVGAFSGMMKMREDKHIEAIVSAQGGNCFLADGTCLHASGALLPFLFGGVLAAALIALGAYLIFFDRTQQQLAAQQREVSQALARAAKNQDRKEKIEAYFAGFTVDEQKLLRVIHEQEGIQQSTLRYRTGLSKTTVSLLLKSLEERGIISRREEGKTNQVYLVHKF